MTDGAQPRRKPYDLVDSAHDYAPWEGPPKRTIVICTHMRSGSTLLGETLYFAGGLGCPLEYFHRGFRPGFEKAWNARELSAMVRAVHARRTEGNGTCSIKLFWPDIEDIVRESDPTLASGPAVAAATDERVYLQIAALIAPIIPNPTFIRLTRRDRVRQAISSLMAAQTGLWRSIPGVGESSATGVPDYDYDRITALIGYIDYCNAHWDKFFASIGVSPYSVAYEDLDRDFGATAHHLLRHLGCAAPVPPQRMRRQFGAPSEIFALRYLEEYKTRQTSCQVGTDR